MSDHRERRGKKTDLGRWVHAQGWTYQRLADALDVSRVTAMKWACGTACPSIPHARDLEALTGIALDVLLSTGPAAVAQPARPASMWSDAAPHSMWATARRHRRPPRPPGPMSAPPKKGKFG